MTRRCCSFGRTQIKWHRRYSLEKAIICSETTLRTVNSRKTSLPIFPTFQFYILKKTKRVKMCVRKRAIMFWGEMSDFFSSFIYFRQLATNHIEREREREKNPNTVTRHRDTYTFNLVDLENGTVQNLKSKYSFPHDLCLPPPPSCTNN